jgi:hypothetical protein
MTDLNEPLWAIAKALDDIASEWRESNRPAREERAREREAEHRAKREREHAEMMKTQCPVCDAAPGEECHRPNGQPLEGWRRAHYRRMRQVPREDWL